MDPLCHIAHRQHILIHIAVVRQDIHRHRHILIRRGIVVHSHRRIVHGIHRNGHPTFIRTPVPIAHRIRETVLTVEVRVRRIREGPIRIQHDRAVARIACRRSRQRIVLRIAVVPQHSGCRHGKQHILIHAVAVVHGGRRIVHRVHRDLKFSTLYRASRSV